MWDLLYTCWSRNGFLAKSASRPRPQMLVTVIHRPAIGTVQCRYWQRRYVYCWGTQLQVDLLHRWW